MNDEEIKKALECCSKGVYAEVCDKCSFKEDGNIVNLNCLNLEKYALDLIDRQQERIEELEIITGLANNRKNYRKFVDEVFCKQKGNELSEPDFDYIYQLFFEQQAEIERLNSLYVSLGTDSLGNDVDVKLKYIYELESKLEAFKAEAIKEFGERLKIDFGHGVLGMDSVGAIIDDLVKEMVGENNDKM